MNIVGAIKLDAINEAVVANYDTVNAETILTHMELIRKKEGNAGVINLVLDQAGYHRAETVIKKAEELNIELHFLPPYCPNLNPIERLWKVMNEHARNNRFFKSAKDFKDALNAFFTKTLPEIGLSLQSRINDNFETI